MNWAGMTLYEMLGTMIMNFHAMPFDRGFFGFTYKITQFFGSPHGPLSSFGSSVSSCPAPPTPGLGVSFGVAVGPVLASLAAPEPAPFTSSSFFPFAAPSLPPSSQSQFTRLTAFQKSLPCWVAMLSSVSLGCLEPSAPAKVPAPQGEPPLASDSVLCAAKVVA